MKVLETIKQRKSVRKFLDKPVTDEQIRLLLEAAMASPSGVNKQPWLFYVLKSDEMKNKLKDKLTRGKFDSPIIIIPCIDESRTFPGEPHDLAFCDLGAVTENILIEAVELGLGSVWCAGWPLKERMDAIREALSLDDTVIPYAMLYIGYEDGNVEPKDKFDETRIHII